MSNTFITQNASSVAVNVDEPARNAGATLKAAMFSFEKTAAMTDASVLVLVPGLSPKHKPVSLKITCDAIAGLTDVDFGFYKQDSVGGDVIDKDILKDGLDPHSGLSTLTEELDLDPAYLGKAAYQLVNTSGVDPQAYGSFDLCATFNTGGTATGSIAGIYEYLE